MNKIKTGFYIILISLCGLALTCTVGVFLFLQNIPPIPRKAKVAATVGFTPQPHVRQVEDVRDKGITKVPQPFNEVKRSTPSETKQLVLVPSPTSEVVVPTPTNTTPPQPTATLQEISQIRNNDDLIRITHQAKEYSTWTNPETKQMIDRYEIIRMNIGMFWPPDDPKQKMHVFMIITNDFYDKKTSVSIQYGSSRPIQSFDEFATINRFFDRVNQEVTRLAKFRD